MALRSSTIAGRAGGRAWGEGAGRAVEKRRPRVVIAEDFVLIQENIRRSLPPECEVIAAVEEGAAALDAVAPNIPTFSCWMYSCRI